MGKSKRKKQYIESKKEEIAHYQQIYDHNRLSIRTIEWPFIAFLFCVLAGYLANVYPSFSIFYYAFLLQFIILFIIAGFRLFVAMRAKDIIKDIEREMRTKL